MNEIASSSSTGTARVTLDLSRNIDGAAREVHERQPRRPADDVARQPDLSQGQPRCLAHHHPGADLEDEDAGPDLRRGLEHRQPAPVAGRRWANVDIGGGSLPAVRIELLPFALNKYGIGAEDVRAAIQASNANRPKGAIQGEGRRLKCTAQTPRLGRRATRRRGAGLVQRHRVRLQDVGAGGLDGIKARAPAAPQRRAGDRRPGHAPALNVFIQTVDSVRALLQAAGRPARDVTLQVASDSANSIRASLREVEITLMISVVLVVLVVSVFLRSVRATSCRRSRRWCCSAPSASCILGFSLNNLSLMALTVATGFVVDDAIVVLENTSRHIEAGMTRMKAALLGAREVGFSASLVAVFIPLLFMGGQVGRLFREFAVTLSAAVMISLVISLTTTPMCAWLLRPGGEAEKPPGRIARLAEHGYPLVLPALRGEPRLGPGQQGAGDVDPGGRWSASISISSRSRPRAFSAAGQRPDHGRGSNQSISSKAMATTSCARSST